MNEEHWLGIGCVVLMLSIVLITIVSIRANTVRKINYIENGYEQVQSIGTCSTRWVKVK